MTYFFKNVILSMSSEQTCLQGFVSEDIHKAQAFCKKCKTIVLKCVSIMRLIIGVKNPTEKVRQYMLYHFGGGIFR